MVASPQTQTSQAHPSSRATHSWFLVLSFVLMFLLSVAAELPLAPNDFFPYVRIGEEIVNTSAIPETEFMTYTQFGKQVDYPYWLPSLIFFSLFKTGGATLISILIVVLTASFYILLWYCLKELNLRPLTAGVVLLLIGLYNASFFVDRPQIFAFPLFSLALLLLIRWQKGDNKWLWLLPVISMLWVNFHGSFIVLFFLTIPALIFGSGSRKRLLIFIALSLLTTLINRYGISAWTDMFSVINNESNRLFSKEFQAPVNEGWQANIFFALLLLTPVLTAILKPKIHILYWIWFLGFGWMALSGIRYGIWFMAAQAIILGLLIDPIMAKIFKPSNHFQNRSMNIFLGILMLIIPVAFLPGVRGLWWEKSPPVYSETTPIKAAEYLKQNPQYPGELWSDFEYSTYLTYALPERKLFMTNRMDDFPVEQYKDERAISAGRFDWQQLLDQYGVNLIMASIDNQPELIRAAASSTAWDEVYRDEYAVIFIRREPIE